MSHKSFRPRPIDVSKKLPIIRSSNELAAIRDDDDGPSIDVAQPHHGMDPDSDEELQREVLVALENEGKGGSDKKLDIPIPMNIKDENYDAKEYLAFRNPTHYIHWKPDETEVEYDMDTDDETWLDTFNGEKKGKAQCADDKFEAVMHYFEKTTGPAGNELVALAQVKANAIGGIPAQLVEKLYAYWTDKRAACKDKEPLVRSLQSLVDANDNDHFKAFRQREKIPVRPQKTRKADVTSLRRIKQVRTEFERVRTILWTVLNREKMKKDLYLSEQHVQNQKSRLRGASPISTPVAGGPGGKKGKGRISGGGGAGIGQGAVEEEEVEDDEAVAAAAPTMFVDYFAEGSRELYTREREGIRLKGSLRLGRGGRLIVDIGRAESPTDGFLWRSTGSRAVKRKRQACDEWDEVPYPSMEALLEPEQEVTARHATLDHFNDLLHDIPYMQLPGGVDPAHLAVNQRVKFAADFAAVGLGLDGRGCVSKLKKGAVSGGGAGGGDAGQGTSLDDADDEAEEEDDDWPEQGAVLRPFMEPTPMNCMFSSMAVADSATASVINDATVAASALHSEAAPSFFEWAR